MKKIVALLSAVVISVSAVAQENQIKRIPTVGSDIDQQQYTLYDRGFWMAAEVTEGISCHFHGKNVALTEIDVTAGYRYNQYLRAGIGIGARYYAPNNDARRRSDIRWAMPIYFNVRGNLVSAQYRTVVPYYSFDIGGTVRDGFMVRPSIGLRIGQPRQAFLIALSYMGQTLASWKVDDNGNCVKAGDFTNFVALRLGFEF